MSLSTDLNSARDLFTAVEFNLLKSSDGTALVNASVAELKKKIAVAREFRDKWRDKHTRQRRSAQKERGARISPENDRSRQKSEFFAGALSRFETHLAKVLNADQVSAPSTSTRKTKTTRNRGHRQTRATVRKQLKPLTTRGASVKSKSASARALATQTPPTPSPPAVTPSVAAPPAKPAAATPVTSKRAKAAKRPARPAKAPVKPGLTASTTRSFGAQTAAKKNRVKMSGLTTRTRGHVSARGKRSQARRDGKTR